MKTSLKMPAVIEPESMSHGSARWNQTHYIRRMFAATKAHDNRNTERLKRRPDPITLRELVVVVGLAAIGLRVLPQPLDAFTALIIPPVYFLTRVYQSLGRSLCHFWCAVWVAVPFVPAWITGDSADIRLANTFLLVTAPTFARFVIWRDDVELWDILDPLVIATALPAMGAIAILTERLAEVGSRACH